MPSNLENSSGHRTGKVKFSFLSQRREMPKNVQTIVLISHFSKIMIKILQARLQQYVNHELPDVQAEFRKCRGTRDQLVNIHWIIEKAKGFQKDSYFSFIDYTKAFDCVDHNKLWKIIKKIGITDHLTCFLRNLYSGQDATVRIGHKTMNWFTIGKEIHQGCILSPCLFNLYAKSPAGGSPSWNQDYREKFQ